MSARFLRFLLAGSINTLFGFFVFFLLALTSLPTWIILLVSNVICFIFNYLTSGGFVFRDLGITRLPRFLLGYGVVYAFYLVLIEWLSPVVGGRHWAMASVILPMAIFTYFIQSRFVFGVKPKS